MGLSRFNRVSRVSRHKTNMGQLMLKTTLLLLVTSASVYGRVADGKNQTSLTGTAGTGSVTIGAPLGDQKSCPPLYSCRRGNKCCYRTPGRRCNYRDCV